MYCSLCGVAMPGSKHPWNSCMQQRAHDLGLKASTASAERYAGSRAPSDTSRTAKADRDDVFGAQEDIEYSLEA